MTSPSFLYCGSPFHQSFINDSICTAITVNQPGRCDERSTGSQPKRVCCSERIKECEIHHHVVCCNCSHFCSSFSTTACVQRSQSTSQVTVTRGALALNPNESAVQSVAKLSKRIKATSSCCCLLWSLLTLLFIFFSQFLSLLTFFFHHFQLRHLHSQYRQPAGSLWRGVHWPSPKTSLLQHYFLWAMWRCLQSSGSEVVRKKPNWQWSGYRNYAVGMARRNYVYDHHQREKGVLFTTALICCEILHNL